MKSSNLSDAHKSWLDQQITGRDLALDRSLIVSQFVQTYPQASLHEIQLVDDYLRAELYKTHKRFEVNDFILCTCKKVPNSVVVSQVEKVKDLEELKAISCAGINCGKCVPELESLLEKKKPKSFRWHGESHSLWGERVQVSLDLWNSRVNKYPPLKVKRFDQGQVVISVEGALTSDQEWDLSMELTDYLAEGFPEPLGVFLDFAHSAAKS